MRIQDLHGQIKSVELFTAIRRFSEIWVSGRADGSTLDTILSRFNGDVPGFEAFHNTWTDEIDLYDKRERYKVVRSFKC
ncbi:hypothetical protein [Parapedobacter sp. 2B3]|uniref:hypothetical protein n=1 Tax=Parapedobacter sp. 2B3 TaxID=3342381 RepID=UPI0035B5C9ED